MIGKGYVRGSVCGNTPKYIAELSCLIHYKYNTISMCPGCKYAECIWALFGPMVDACAKYLHCLACVSVEYALNVGVGPLVLLSAQALIVKL